MSSQNSSSNSAPLAVINDTDQGGLVAILGGFALSLVFVSLPIRIYARVKTSRPGTDDYAFLGACVLSIAQAATVFYELHNGLGKTADLIQQDKIEPIQKAAYASDILYIFALACSKALYSLVVLTADPQRGYSLVVWATLSPSIIWALVSTFLVALRCHPLHPWTDVDSTCEYLFVRWQVIGASGIVTEVGLFAISIYLVWTIKISLRSKAIIVAAFGCRLPVIAIAGVRLYFLDKQIQSSDPTYVAAWTVCCTQLEIGFGIVANIIPCLRIFIVAYEPATTTQQHYYRYGKNSSYMLSSMTSKPESEPAMPQRPAERARHNDDAHVLTSGVSDARSNRSRGKLEAGAGGLRGERDAFGGFDSSKSLESESSQRIMIKRAVEWSVDYSTPLRKPVWEMRP